MNQIKHVSFMSQILTDIWSDPILANVMGFKGGTAAYFFYNLPRFSTDLDFNILEPEAKEDVYNRLLNIVSRYGEIKDANLKHYGPVIVLDYGKGESNLKVEATCRLFDNHFEKKSLFGKTIDVMSEEDMFTHKLCALLERNAPRDVFDVWYFSLRGVSLNEHIINERTEFDTKELLMHCADKVSKISPAALMPDLGELLTEKQKAFVKSKLIGDLTTKLNILSAYPSIATQTVTYHTELLERNCSLIPELRKNGIEPSMISVQKLEELVLNNASISLKNKKGLFRQFRFLGNKLIEESGPILDFSKKQ